MNCITTVSLNLTLDTIIGLTTICADSDDESIESVGLATVAPEVEHRRLSEPRQCLDQNHKPAPGSEKTPEPPNPPFTNS